LKVEPEVIDVLAKSMESCEVIGNIPDNSGEELAA
jgi:hypothetical protein